MPPAEEPRPTDSRGFVDLGPERDLLFQLYRTNQVSVSLVDATLDAFGVADGFAAMSVLGHLGPMTPTALSRRLGMGQTTTSALIRRLVERGHTEQTRN